MKRLIRGWSIIRSSGLRSFLSDARSYMSRVSLTRSGLDISYQTGTRTDFESRLELLQNHIDDRDSIIDIGCAEGDFVAAFADKHFAIGIERRQHTVQTARRRHPDALIMQFDVTPDTIDMLPDVNVILLLAVYHHWVGEFGVQSATDMLSVLQQKSDKLFVEIPSGFGLDCQKKYLGTVDYDDSERTDEIYLV